MTKDDYDEWTNNEPSSRPNSNAKIVVVKWMYAHLLPSTYVRRERLMLARPMAEFPKH
jgi:hypothetical protein